METVAYMAAFLAFIWCISLSEKVSYGCYERFCKTY